MHDNSSSRHRVISYTTLNRTKLANLYLYGLPSVPRNFKFRFRGDSRRRRGTSFINAVTLKRAPSWKLVFKLLCSVRSRAVAHLVFHSLPFSRERIILLVCVAITRVKAGKENHNDMRIHHEIRCRASHDDSAVDARRENDGAFARARALLFASAQSARKYLETSLISLITRLVTRVAAGGGRSRLLVTGRRRR